MLLLLLMMMMMMIAAAAAAAAAAETVVCHKAGPSPGSSQQGVDPLIMSIIGISEIRSQVFSSICATHAPKRTQAAHSPAPSLVQVLRNISRQSSAVISGDGSHA